MIDKKTIAMFEEQQIRRIWNEDERYFVLEDIILALVNSNDPKQYIKKMRQRDPELQKGWVQFVPTLKVLTTPQSLWASRKSTIQRLKKMLISIAIIKEIVNVWMLDTIMVIGRKTVSDFYVCYGEENESFYCR